MSEETLSDSDFVDDSYDPLFGGEKLISLFDKTIKVGVERTGIITKAPEERHSRFFADGKAGKLKYWPANGGRPTEDSVGPDGKPNKPVMDQVFVLQTDYRLDATDLAERNMDPDEDTGIRGVFAAGEQLKAIQGAIREAKIPRSVGRRGLVGMRLTLKRTGKVKKGEFMGWTWAAKLTGTPAAASSPFADPDA